MEELLQAGLVIPLATLLIVVGLLCLFASVFGLMRGTSAPDQSIRLAAGVLGAALLGVGLGIYFLHQEQQSAPPGVPPLATKPPPAGSMPAAQRGEASRTAAVMTDFEYSTTRAGGDYRGFRAQYPSD
jgi:hypothetical protein